MSARPGQLEKRLQALRARGQRGLSPYLTAGDGGVGRSLALLAACEQAGAACAELGMPHSDPIADGPELQAAAERALAQGTRFETLLEILERSRAAGRELPVVVMTYVNPLLAHGLAASLAALARAGADGILVADLPVEEGSELAELARAAGLAPIFFAAPTSSPERLERAARASRGFLYAIARLGVTGSGARLDAEAQAFLARCRAAAGELPLAAGFGIRSAADVAAATEQADLAIVGSAFVALAERTARAGGEAAVPAAARAYLEELSRGLER